MNEEHDSKKQNPGTATFDVSIGDRQRRGDRVLAVPPSMGHVPVGIAPPDPLNVVSVFDTRPISAYDFAHDGSDIMSVGDAATPLDVSMTVPGGYTAVLRSVRWEFIPNGSVNLDSTTANTMNLNLLRNGAVIDNNVLVLRGALDTFVWETHQVFGQGETLGARVRGSWLVPVADLLVSVHLQGVLIPTKNRPPEVEIASAPVITQSLDERKAEVQR